MADTKQTTQRTNRKQRDTQHPERIATLHAGRWKTMTERFEYESDLTNSFLNQNSRRIIQLFERLAMIIKTAKQDEVAYRKVMDWHSQINLAIANEQLETISEQLAESTAKMSGFGSAQVNIPDMYHIEFEVSHPVTRSILNTLGSIDKVATQVEQSFYEGKIDDLQLENARKQTMKIMNGILDRIGKVTSPGKRDNGQFSTGYYVSLLKDPGFDLVKLTDMPLEIRKSLGLLDDVVEVNSSTTTKETKKVEPNETKAEDKNEPLKGVKKVVKKPTKKAPAKKTTTKPKASETALASEEV